MSDFINNLRSKSDEEKKKWAVIFASIATGCVVIAWLVVRFVFISPEPRIMIDPMFKNQADYIFTTSLEQFGNLGKDQSPTSSEERLPPAEEGGGTQGLESTENTTVDSVLFFDNEMYSNTETQEFDEGQSTNFFN